MASTLVFGKLKAMDVLTTQGMIDCEGKAFASGITASALMEAVGEAMAGRIRAAFPRATEFLVLVGKGHNGGDGLVVARHLVSRGRLVRVVLAFPVEKMGELPRTCLERLHGLGPNLTITDWKSDLEFPGSNGVVIDALLGLQARGPLRGELAEIVAALNSARAGRFFRTVALDLPTGLGGWEGETETPERDGAVVADLTLAVGFAKEILCREEMAAWVGRLEIIPWSVKKLDTAPRQVLVPHELANLLPRRGALTFKNDFGHLAIVSGSAGFSGAPVLCAQGAQAIGVGLLSVVTRPEVEGMVAAQVPAEGMVSAWPENLKTPEVVEKATTIVFGPGLGTGDRTKEMLRAVLAVGCPVLIDADGLNVLARNLDLLAGTKSPIILTPHVGEMARLIGRKFSPDERESVARAFVDRHEVTLVLKGTRTLVTSRGESFYINTTGNPGLSTGGSGDTLSGIIGGLLAQKLKPLEAARLGVWIHGHAADLALQDRGCEEGLTPTLLSQHLGAALVSLRTQAMLSSGLLEKAAHQQPS